MHFYGLSRDELRALSGSEHESLWHAITVIEAQSLLLQLSVADYPHMKRDARSKLHRKFYSLAYPQESSGERLTTEQFAERLRALLSG